VSISNKIGLIERFVIAEGKVYVIAKKIVPLCNAFYSSSCPELKLYRYLVNSLFTGIYELGNSNANSMLKNHPKLNVCRGKKSLNNKYQQVLTFRSYITFIFKILKSSSKVYVLIWIQQLKKQFFEKFDARQKVWNKFKKPSHLFIVDGTDYKFKSKSAVKKTKVSKKKTEIKSQFLIK